MNFLKKIPAKALVFFVMTAATLGASGMAHADSDLGKKMIEMAVALKHLSVPAPTNALDELKVLKEAAVYCRDHSDELAPVSVAGVPERLAAFKAEFVTLVGKIEALETAFALPADAANRDAQIKAAIAGVNLVKKSGHTQFMPE